MITVEDALAKSLDLVSPLTSEIVPLAESAGRVLAETVTANRDQPPFASSAMDGYAVTQSEVSPGAKFTVIGESAAGHGYNGDISAGQTVRIFTGAPVPNGADRVIIQEDTTRNGDIITLNNDLDEAIYVRKAGADFTKGTAFSGPRRLGPNDLALLASMNISQVPVSRKPVIAIIATGDELVMPGENPNADQIIASNSFGLAALVRNEGAEARMMPIARDTNASLETVLNLASDADLIVTIGGASVGDHDLVGSVAASMGLERSFYNIAMRPGKPLMAGRLGNAVLLGLPGNPVSTMVCGHIFLLPMIRTMLGLGRSAAPHRTATLAAPLSPNGKREHYMRAHIEDGEITGFDRQDSALLTVLATANALLIRPVNDGSRNTGERVDYIPI
ncbi:MAG: molybdopterin molybdotransferase MoeA [Paracoccaceae bacterium]